MPKLYERERKLNLLSHGENVRPPYNWFYTMKLIIQRQYPDKDDTEVNQVLGGIWNSYGVETKMKIVKEYQTNNTHEFNEHKNVIGRL